MDFFYHLKLFLATLAVFLGIDFVWLGLVAKKFYDKHLAAFERTLNWPAAMGTYLLLALGGILFVLPKAAGKPTSGFVWGALFGLITYGVYDLVNLATLADWSLTMVVVDVLWGMFLCGIVSLIVAFTSTWLK